jgi:hypothetical protein
MRHVALTLTVLGLVACTRSVFTSPRRSGSAGTAGRGGGRRVDAGAHSDGKTRHREDWSDAPSAHWLTLHVLGSSGAASWR